MSVSYSADFVCGFNLEIESVSKRVTKYDENTGRAYEVDVPLHDVAKVDGVQIGSKENNIDAFCPGEKIDKLEIGESGYEQGDKWIGHIIATVGGYGGDFHDVSVEVPKDVMAFAAKYGLTPKWLLSMRCG